MKNKKKDGFFSKYKYIIAIFIATLLMSVGYSSINNVTLDLTGRSSMVATTGVFIHEATINQAANADVNSSEIQLFYQTMLRSKVALLTDNLNSTLPITITVYNKSAYDVYFDDVIYSNEFYDNNHIDYTLSGISHLQKLAKNTSVTFTITFKYTNAYKNSSPSQPYDNILNSYLNFRFLKGYDIIYTDISGSGYTSLVLEGGNLSVNFGANATDDIEVTGLTTGTTYTKGTHFTYTNGVLTFNNVTESLEVTGITYGPQIVYSNATTYDHTTLTANQITVFNNIAGKPKVTVDANGIITSFEYTDVGSGVVFSEGSSFNTGVNAFDTDKGYTIHLKFTMDSYDNVNRDILSAMKKSNGNKYNGFIFYVYSASRFYINATASGSNINGGTFGTRLCDGWQTTSGSKTYTLDMTYTPSPNKAITATLTPSTSGSPYTASSNNLSYYPDTLNDSSIVLGGNIANHNKDIDSMIVLEFSVSKTN